MMGPTHIRFGAVCAVACYPAPLLAVPLAAVFATFPDLDQKQSTASKWLPPLGWFVRLWAGGHRRRTHLLTRRSQLSLVALAVYVAVVAGLVAANHTLAWGFAIGYTSHLLGDWIFDGNRRWGPKTNGWLEKHLAPVFWLIALAGAAARVYFAL